MVWTKKERRTRRTGGLEIREMTVRQDEGMKRTSVGHEEDKNGK
jgi:hypothetical protein